MTTQFIQLSQPRTACVMLQRVLSKQSGVDYADGVAETVIPLQAKWLTDEASWYDISPAQRDAVTGAAHKGVALWAKQVESAAEKGNKYWVHVHPAVFIKPEYILEFVAKPKNAPVKARNCTMIPDELLLRPGSKPYFTIRHPVLWITSLYKVILGNFGVSKAAMYHYAIGTLHWSRELYEWYVQHGITPLVIDAEDYQSSEQFVRHFCATIGLNPDEAYLSWPQTPKEEIAKMPPLLHEIQKNLFTSEGLLPGRSSRNVDLGEERTSWDERFGKEGGDVIRELVELSMSDYEWLREQRLCMEPVRSTEGY